MWPYLSLSFHLVCIGRKKRYSLAVGGACRAGLAAPPAGAPPVGADAPAAAVDDGDDEVDEDEARRDGGEDEGEPCGALGGEEEARCAWTWARRAGGVIVERTERVCRALSMQNAACVARARERLEGAGKDGRGRQLGLAGETRQDGVAGVVQE